MLNSWSFYQLKIFVDYKAKLRGIAVVYVDPRNTSKTCSRYVRIGSRTNNMFKCLYGHIVYADGKVLFNIA
ncbi:MAG: zinc ribbon domain-containing protein [Candidatus Hodarchaeales archaeon]